jgi:hypothetical protein
MTAPPTNDHRQPWAPQYQVPPPSRKRHAVPTSLRARAALGVVAALIVGVGLGAATTSSARTQRDQATRQLNEARAANAGVVASASAAVASSQANAAQASSAAAQAKVAATNAQASANTAAQASLAAAKQALDNSNSAAVASIAAGKNAVAAGAASVKAAQASVDALVGRVQSSSILGDGTFLVGSEIKPGTYHTDSPSSGNCYWEREAGSNTGDIENIIANDNTSGPTTITISSSDYAFKDSGCETWYPVG